MKIQMVNSSEDDSDDYKKGAYENDGDFFIYPSPKKSLKNWYITMLQDLCMVL